MKRLFSLFLCACLLSAALPAASLSEETLPSDAPEALTETAEPEPVGEPAETTPEETPAEAPEDDSQTDAPESAPVEPTPEEAAPTGDEAPDESSPEEPEIPAEREPEAPADEETADMPPEEGPAEEQPSAEDPAEEVPEEEILSEDGGEVLREEAAAAVEGLEIVDGVVVRYTGAAAEVVIPEGVTTIDKKAFSKCETLKKVVFPSTLRIIGENAFYCCSGLTGISLPEGLECIRAKAFQECANLKTVSLPATLTSIGEYAFYKCPVSSVSLPAGLRELGGAAFAYTNLRTVSVPEGIECLYSTFSHCEQLTSCTLPSSTRELWHTFYNCVNLASVNLPEGLQSIGEETFYHCHHLEEINLPESLTTIDTYAFAYCVRLRTLSIPASVSKLSSYVVYQCTALTSLTIAAGNQHYKAIDGVVYSKDGTRLFFGAHCVTRVDIPRGVTSIANGAFWNNESLSSLTLPEGLENIGTNAFRGCRALTYVRLPGTVSSISYSAFEGCGGTENRHLRVDVYCNPRYIYAHAFMDCGVTFYLYADSSIFRSYAKKGGYRLVDYSGSLVYSASCSRDTVPAGSRVTFTVETGCNIESLTMYAEKGNAVKTWEVSEDICSVGEDRILWTLPYTFNVSGNRAVTFRAISDDPGVSVKVKVLAREPNVAAASAQSEDGIVRVKTPVQFTVTTPDTANYLGLFTETGKKVKVWSRTGNSTVSNGVRTWKIKYSFANTGHRRVSFRASTHGNYGDGKTVALLVAIPGPVVREASGPASVEGKQAAAFTVTTTSDAKYLALFAENGAKVRVWSAAAHSTLSNGRRVWEVSYSFANTGNRTVEFRTGDAGGEYGFGEKVSIMVNKVFADVLSVKATPTSLLTGEEVTFTVTTAASAKKLVMHTKIKKTVDGRTEYESIVVKTYGLQYAAPSGEKLVWTVKYRIKNAGSRYIFFAADAGYGIESGSRLGVNLTVY